MNTATTNHSNTSRAKGSNFDSHTLKGPTFAKKKKTASVFFNDSTNAAVAATNAGQS